MTLASWKLACSFCSLIAVSLQFSAVVKPETGPPATEAPFELLKRVEELSVLSIQRWGPEVQFKRLSFWLKQVDAKKESFELEYLLVGSTAKRKMRGRREDILTFPEAETFWIEVAEVNEDNIVGSVHIQETKSSQIRVSRGETGHWVPRRSPNGEMARVDPTVLGIPLRESTRKVGVAEGLTPPQVLFHAIPSYTEAALKAKIQGVIILQCTIGEDGLADPFSLQAVSGLGYGLEEQSMEALARQWRFQPAMIKGAPVDVQATMEVTFNLRSQP